MKVFLTEIEQQKVLKLAQLIRLRMQGTKDIQALAKIEKKENFSHYVACEYDLLKEHHEFLLQNQQQWKIIMQKDCPKEMVKLGVSSILKELTIGYQKIIKESVSFESKPHIASFLPSYRTLSKERQESLIQLNCHPNQEILSFLEKYSLFSQNNNQVLLSKNILSYYQQLENLYFLYSDLLKQLEQEKRSDPCSFQKLEEFGSYLQEQLEKQQNKLTSLESLPELATHIAKYHNIKQLEQLNREIVKIETDPSLPNIWIPIKHLTIGNTNCYKVSCVIHKIEKEVSAKELPYPLFVCPNKSVLRSREDRVQVLEELGNNQLKKFCLHKNSRRGD